MIDFIFKYPGCIVVPFLVVAFFYMLAKARGDFWGLFFSDETNNTGIEFERQHLIENIETGYPMHVNDVELSRAIQTGDYKLVQRNHGGGILFSGWVYNGSNGGRGQMADNLHIPAGHRIVKEHKYKDKRLNK